MDWFLYDRNFRHERINPWLSWRHEVSPINRIWIQHPLSLHAFYNPDANTNVNPTPPVSLHAFYNPDANTNKSWEPLQ